MDIRSSLESLQRIFESPPASEARGITPSALAKSSRAPVDLPADEASVSRVASLVGRALALPDIRADKIAGIQQAIAAGTYQVSASAVAGALIEHMLAN
jgi:negative regulator of flagellin synthesis FlgM